VRGAVLPLCYANTKRLPAVERRYSFFNNPAKEYSGFSYISTIVRRYRGVFVTPLTLFAEVPEL
jgi:hypothetical protein